MEILAKVKASNHFSDALKRHVLEGVTTRLAYLERYLPGFLALSTPGEAGLDSPRSVVGGADPHSVETSSVPLTARPPRVRPSI